ncbi:hypothetical protein C8R44DRAFT_740402 [Mycena epipterygia]|nr:hypothetical protein C8R44DRAFT_740402 [Mycena epipterygia]
MFYSHDKPDPSLILTGSRQRKQASDPLNAEPVGEFIIYAYQSRLFDSVVYPVAAVIENTSLTTRVSSPSESISEVPTLSRALVHCVEVSRFDRLQKNIVPKCAPPPPFVPQESDFKLSKTRRACIRPAEPAHPVLPFDTPTYATTRNPETSSPQFFKDLLTTYSPFCATKKNTIYALPTPRLPGDPGAMSTPRLLEIRAVVAFLHKLIGEVLDEDDCLAMILRAHESQRSDVFEEEPDVMGQTNGEDNALFGGFVSTSLDTSMSGHREDWKERYQRQSEHNGADNARKAIGKKKTKKKVSSENLKRNNTENGNWKETTQDLTAHAISTRTPLLTRRRTRIGPGIDLRPGLGTHVDAVGGQRVSLSVFAHLPSLFRDLAREHSIPRLGAAAGTTLTPLGPPTDHPFLLQQMLSIRWDLVRIGVGSFSGQRHSSLFFCLVTRTGSRSFWHLCWSVQSAGDHISTKLGNLAPRTCQHWWLMGNPSRSDQVDYLRPHGTPGAPAVNIGALHIRKGSHSTRDQVLSQLLKDLLGQSVEFNKTSQRHAQSLSWSQAVVVYCLKSTKICKWVGAFVYEYQAYEHPGLSQIPGLGGLRPFFLHMDPTVHGAHLHSTHTLSLTSPTRIALFAPRPPLPL